MKALSTTLAALAFMLASPAARAQSPDDADAGAPEPAPDAGAPEPAAKPPEPVKVEPAPPPAQGPPAKVAPATPDAEDDWTRKLRLELGPLALRPILLLQVQASPYVGSDSSFQTGDIAEKGGFRLRRARLGFGGDLAARARFALSAELGGGDEGTARIHDAWVGYTQFELAQLFAGAHDVPYSRSAMVGAGDTALIERPLAVRAMAPFHQVGAHLEGHIAKGAFSYYAGAYNALQRTDQFYEGYIENYAAFGNRFGGLVYAARLATEPLGELGPTIEDVDHSPFRVGAGASYFFSDGGARDIHGAGGDVLLHVAGFHVLGELLWSKSIPESVPTQPTTQTAEVTALALVGEAGYMIVRRRFGLNARVEWIDPNDAVKNEGDDFLFTIGVSYRILGEVLKAQAEYTHRTELYGVAFSNDSVTLALQLHL